MRFSLSSMVKLIGFLSIVGFAAAVEMVRLEPHVAHFRMTSSPDYGMINGFVLNTSVSRLTFLNDSSGALESFDLPAGESLDFASSSPWVDDQGQHQVVGRWERHDAKNDPYQAEAFGVARYAMPSGRLIGNHNVEVVPVSHPCWYPGNVSRVLYAGADGQLYQLDFRALDRHLDEDGAEDEAFSADNNPVPQMIRWRCEAPGQGLMVMDPIWNADPRLGGRLIVALSYREKMESPRLSRSHLWWLELSPEGDEVVAAGPLDETIRTEDANVKRGDERHPSLCVTPSGEIALAYLRQLEDNLGKWELHLTNLNFDPNTRRPTFQPDASRTLALGHLSEAPRFSTDGSRVFGILRDASEFGGKIVGYSSDIQAPESSHAVASLSPG